ncbi:ArsR/SmtB family transcription factor [Halosolutus halophilus]|uniref:ArsR/SmtB family transcription factor n=1 Tax=Halosolutus halophilus TaxID=1552990 RepID=UPI002234F636|nr:metalloregulator ArsR/SmtB family transcription factor [Halosolutus halophilus]
MSSDDDHLADACCTVEQLRDDVADPVADLEGLRSDAERVETQTAVYGALANEHRVRILEALRDGERCVCELQVVLDAPQSTVATHLRTLREAGLVKSRKKGRWTYYRIADTAVFELLDVAAAVDVPDDD